MVNKKFEISITEYDTDPDFVPTRFRECSVGFIVPDQLFRDNSHFEMRDCIFQSLKDCSANVLETYIEGFYTEHWRPIQDRKVVLNDVLKELQNSVEHLKTQSDKKVPIDSVMKEYQKLVDKLGRL